MLPTYCILPRSVACKFYCLLGVIEHVHCIINLHFHFSQSRQRKPFKHRFERETHYSTRFGRELLISSGSPSQTHSTLTTKIEHRNKNEVWDTSKHRAKGNFKFYCFYLKLLWSEKNTQIAAIHPLGDIDPAVDDPPVRLSRLHLHLHQTTRKTNNHSRVWTNLPSAHTKCPSYNTSYTKCYQPSVTNHNYNPTR